MSRTSGGRPESPELKGGCVSSVKQMEEEIASLWSKIREQETSNRQRFLTVEMAFEKEECRRLELQKQITALEAENRHLLRLWLANSNPTPIEELAALKTENRRLKELRRKDKEFAIQEAETNRLLLEKELSARDVENLRLQLREIADIWVACRRLLRGIETPPLSTGRSREKSESVHSSQKDAEQLGRFGLDSELVGIPEGVFDSNFDWRSRKHLTREEKELLEHRLDFWQRYRGNL